VKDPLIDRLLQISNDFRHRHAKMKSAEEEPLITPLDAARELKKLRRIDDGLANIAHMQKFFLEWATKYDSAFAVYGIPLLPARANLMRMFANSFRDDETAIRTVVQIEQERTETATSRRQQKTAAVIETRRNQIKGICDEKGWNSETQSLPKQVWHELKGMGVRVSQSTVERDLKNLFPHDDVVTNKAPSAETR
jgi:hypothetical protein